MVRRWLPVCLLVVLPVLTTTTLAQSHQQPERPAEGGDFSLTDQDGRLFRLSDHRGKVILLFFGYTSCTEACPVMLGRINAVFKQLGADRNKALAVFISVDPARDTTSVLKDYVQYFSANTAALTGNKKQIDAVVRQYGAKYEIEKSDSALGYHVNHTTDIYLIDRRGTLQERFKFTDRGAAIVDCIKHLLR